MDADSLSQGLLSSQSTFRHKAFKGCDLRLCALGLVLMIGTLLLSGSSQDPTSRSTSIVLNDDPANVSAVSESLASLNISSVDPQKLKAVIKEGGKRGVEIEGAADLGGTQYFCAKVDEPEGDVGLLLESVKAMNVQPDPNSEERKGCSGHIGKVIFSTSDTQLAALAYVPEEKWEEVVGEEWIQAIIGPYEKNGAKIVSKAKDYTIGIIPQDADNGIFPLKIRDDLIKVALDFLRAKKLFPEPNDESSDDMVFGDDVDGDDFGT